MIKKYFVFLPLVASCNQLRTSNNMMNNSADSNKKDEKFAQRNIIPSDEYKLSRVSAILDYLKIALDTYRKENSDTYDMQETYLKQLLVKHYDEIKDKFYDLVEGLDKNNRKDWTGNYFSHHSGRHKYDNFSDFYANNSYAPDVYINSLFAVAVYSGSISIIKAFLDFMELQHIVVPIILSLEPKHYEKYGKKADSEGDIKYCSNNEIEYANHVDHDLFTHILHLGNEDIVKRCMDYEKKINKRDDFKNLLHNGLFLDLYNLKVLDPLFEESSCKQYIKNTANAGNIENTKARACLIDKGLARNILHFYDKGIIKSDILKQSKSRSLGCSYEFFYLVKRYADLLTKQVYAQNLMHEEELASLKTMMKILVDANVTIMPYSGKNFLLYEMYCVFAPSRHENEWHWKERYNEEKAIKEFRDLIKILSQHGDFKKLLNDEIKNLIKFDNIEPVSYLLKKGVLKEEVMEEEVLCLFKDTLLKKDTK